MLKAIQTVWPTTIVQRCRFHAWLNVKTKLTLHPEATAGQELLALTKVLLQQVHTRRQARRWKRNLRHWYSKHGDYIAERTVTSNPGARQRRWHFTHARLRSAYRQLRTIQDDLLRSSYRPNPSLPRTTNYLEGGINSQLRTKLKLHRGLSYEHQMKLVEQYLYSRTEAADAAPVSP